MAWGNLPIELWTEVFSRLNTHGRVDRGSLPECGSYEGSEFAKLYTLRAVCKRFNTALLQHPDIQSTLFVTEFPTSDNIKHLIGWIWRLDNLEKLVLGTNAACTAAVLTALSQCQCTVKLASVEIIHTDIGLQLISALQHVHTLVLKAEFMEDDKLSLSSLSSLHLLTDLQLEDGHYTDLDAAVALQSLSLIYCTVSGSNACKFTSSLTKLFMGQASLYDVHQCGLMACNSLQNFYCSDARVTVTTAANNFVLFAGQPVEGFSNVSALSALTHLCLSVEGPSQPYLDLQCLAALRLLKKLNLDILDQDIALPQSLHSLKKLEDFSVQCYGQQSASRVMTCNVEWQAWASLQSLSLQFGVVVFQCDLCTLVTLPFLKHVKLAQSSNIGAESVQQVAYLGHKLGMCRPEIEFIIEVIKY